jgi:inhibitor of cysteine peptidase
MKKVSVLLTLVLVLFLACKTTSKEKTKGVKADYEIAVGESFTLELPTNPSTGYSWMWMNKSNASLLDSINYTYVPKKPIMMGSGGTAVWKFKGIKKGIDSIQLNYCRPWELNAPVQVKTIVVKVK